MATAPTSKVSERFCAPDADLTILSSDGVLFKVHRKNLEVHSPVFSNAENTTKPENGDEAVHLTESSAVLELLFQFMYSQPQPDLESLEFGTFAGLAEAAEKYSVYSALTLCRMKMKDSISAHPLEVLRYAVRHDHVDLANESALQSMGRGFAEALEVLPLDIFKKWILFHERWHKETLLALTETMTQNPGISFVRDWMVDPNPVLTFRKQGNGLAGIFNRKFLHSIAKIKFLPEPTDAK